MRLGAPPPTDEQTAERQEDVELALGCLKDAIAAGASNIDQMRRNPDLAPLRELSEFQAALCGQEERTADDLIAGRPAEHWAGEGRNTEMTSALTGSRNAAFSKMRNSIVALPWNVLRRDGLPPQEARSILA